MMPPSSAKVTAPQNAITEQMTQTMRFQPEVPAYPATMAGPRKDAGTDDGTYNHGRRSDRSQVTLEFGFLAEGIRAGVFARVTHGCLEGM